MPISTRRRRPKDSLPTIPIFILSLANTPSQLARKDAFALVAADAGLRQPERALLRQAVLDRYGKTLDLAAIG